MLVHLLLIAILAVMISMRIFQDGESRDKITKLLEKVPRPSIVRHPTEDAS
jgi:hypothetical protein